MTRADIAIKCPTDGPDMKLPGPNSEMNMAMAFAGNDAAVRAQVSYAYLKTRAQTSSPFFGGESAWMFGAKLDRPW